MPHNRRVEVKLRDGKLDEDVVFVGMKWTSEEWQAMLAELGYWDQVVQKGGLVLTVWLDKNDPHVIKYVLEHAYGIIGEGKQYQVSNFDHEEQTDLFDAIVGSLLSVFITTMERHAKEVVLGQQKAETFRKDADGRDPDGAEPPVQPPPQ